MLLQGVNTGGGSGGFRQRHTETLFGHGTVTFSAALIFAGSGHLQIIVDDLQPFVDGVIVDDQFFRQDEKCFTEGFDGFAAAGCYRFFLKLPQL